MDLQLATSMQDLVMRADVVLAGKVHGSLARAGKVGGVSHAASDSTELSRKD